MLSKLKRLLGRGRERTPNDARTEAVLKKSQDWMAYIDAEVAAVCRKNGWGRQIRRKWSVREKPVSSSLIDDYEWKLLLGGETGCREDMPNEFDEGTYFVLGFDSSNGKFILQHDTNHCGVIGDHWLTCTYTEINLWHDTMAETIDQLQHSGRSTDLVGAGGEQEDISCLGARSGAPA